jgi:hypothetical protein
VLDYLDWPSHYVLRVAPMPFACVVQYASSSVSAAVLVCQVLVVAEHQPQGVHGELESKVRPLKVGKQQLTRIGWEKEAEAQLETWCCTLFLLC